MKAIVIREFGAPSVMKLETVADPVPGAGQVLIRVGAAGVNPVDTYVRSGAYARKPPLPHTPGFDVGGTVEAAGPEVIRVKPGDRVYASLVSGGYAERVVCDESQVWPIPAGISFEQGAAVGVPYVTAWLSLFNRAGARPGESVLIHGASGGVGLAAVQVARAHGMRVIGTAGTSEGLRAVSEQGAHAALNHHEPGYLDQIPALTGGKGPDVILEMLANIYLDHDLDVVAMRGRIVVIGNRGPTQIDARKTMGKYASILGVMVFFATRDELREANAGVAAGLESGAFLPMVSRVVPLAEAPQAHDVVMSPGALGKIVLTA
jgi:NADPH2:quinone reductase